MKRSFFFLVAPVSLLLIAFAIVGILWRFGALGAVAGFFSARAEAPAGLLFPESPPTSRGDKTPALDIPRIRAAVTYRDGYADIHEEILLTAFASEFRGYIYAENFAASKISSVSSSSGIASFRREGGELFVSFEDECDRLMIEYSVELPQTDDILSFDPSGARLTNFLIVPAISDGGSYLAQHTSGFGDPFVYEMYDYDVTISAPRKYYIYAPGELENNVSGDTRTARFASRNARDFPALLTARGDAELKRFGDTDVFYIGGAADCSPFVERALEFASENIGPYPYGDLFIVRTKLRNNSGMEFSRMIFVNDDVFGSSEALKGLLYHEVFHQWFYGIIGVDQLNEPFMDEGLVTWLTAYLRNAEPSAAGYRFDGKPLTAFRSKEAYTAHAYTDAARWFSGIHRRMGDDFFPMLQRVYDDYGYKILRYEDFLKYVR